MDNYDVHYARANKERAKTMANTNSPFTIEVRFFGGLTSSQKSAFADAADRWAKIILGDLPDVMVAGEVVDDVVIDAQGVSIDGPGGVLGQAGTTAYRPSGGATGLLPAKGIMSFDKEDMANMEENGSLNDVITHEMGHVLGIARDLWEAKDLLNGCGTVNVSFVGEAAMQEYGRLVGDNVARPVPVEESGGAGTACSHWRNTNFGNELMTGWVDPSPNPLSRMTAASLSDLGYIVDLNATNPYTLPSQAQLAEKKHYVLELGTERGYFLPVIPITLPPAALVHN